MRLLILTQAIDRTNPVLGFMHAWVEKLALQCESVVVVCLEKGDFALPSNVRVLSLGKEEHVGRPVYLKRFFTYITSERNNYDAVFVHMNQEYVLLGGLLWRLLGKRIVLWRNHKKGNLLTALAVMLAHVVVCTSPSSYTKRFKKTVLMPVGIDTDIFARTGNAQPRSILFFGRLDPVKRAKEYVSALKVLHEKGIEFKATLCGAATPGNESYAEEVKKLAAPLVEAGVLSLQKGIQHSEAPALFQLHQVYVNLTPSGSFDKTMLEAAACGCLPVTANEVLASLVPQLMVGENPAGAIEHALSLSEVEREALQKKIRSFVVEHHSLSFLVRRILQILS